MSTELLNINNEVIISSNICADQTSTMVSEKEEVLQDGKHTNAAPLSMCETRDIHVNENCSYCKASVDKIKALESANQHLQEEIDRLRCLVK